MEDFRVFIVKREHGKKDIGKLLTYDNEVGSGSAVLSM